jgi:hypothetical protein
VAPRALRDKGIDGMPSCCRLGCRSPKLLDQEGTNILIILTSAAADAYKTRRSPRYPSPHVLPHYGNSHIRATHPLLLAVIAFIPSHGVRYTALELLLAAVILCKIHLQPPELPQCSYPSLQCPAITPRNILKRQR